MLSNKWWSCQIFCF